MEQVTSALIGFLLVLTALFAPMAFFSGSTGIIYRQFSVTIVSAMVLSVSVALILTPVLCANILKPVAKGHEAAEGGMRFLRPFFLWFDHGFNWFRDRFVAFVGYGLARQLRFVVVYILIVGGLLWIFKSMPTGYLPDEDLEKLYVRNTTGKMVPFSSFASGHWASGSPKLERFNGFPSMNTG